uniref:Uncharacterized protein n=1 Tax=Fundulus heteroclitus TaxID=8078 RepID=A0A3Q2QWI2_FUNHE
MEHDLRMGLSLWTIMAIVCNSVVGLLILILFVVLYKACKVPSHQEKVLFFAARLDQKNAEEKYMLTAA